MSDTALTPERIAELRAMLDHKDVAMSHGEIRTLLDAAALAAAEQLRERMCRCRCGHEWITRDQDRPRVCPKCKSANWDKPKKWERNAESQKEGL